ncbi:MAG TPA: hypothetical protein VGG39_26825 [Polyangiaceae bacterium]|jgi:anti-sigma-K factor RskA
MTIGTFVFTETSPSAPGTAVSSRSVQGAASYLAAGIAGPIDDYDGWRAILDAPANTSGGALGVYLQSSPDGGLSWWDRVAFASIVNSAAAASYAAPISLATATTAPVVVGKNTSPALAAGTVVGGAPGDRLRLVMVAGGGTTSSITITLRLVSQRRRVREYAR